MKPVLIFDFFGVFCSSIATDWFKTTKPDKAGLAAFQALCTESDYGRLTRAEFNQAASKLSGIPVPEIIRGIEAETHINTSLVKYVETLRARGYRIACLSNGTHEWTLRVIVDHGLEHLFDEIVLSGDLGIVKPSPEIYTHTLDKLGLKPAQAIFVDDRQSNNDAAEALGIRSLLFTDTQTFIKDLESLLTSRL